MIAHISPLLALAAGVASFLSPCVLPLVPAYLAYLGGRVGREDGGAEGVATAAAGNPDRASAAATGRPALLICGVAFVAGLSLVFVLFFYAFATLLGPVRPYLAPVAGIGVILLAAEILGVLRLGIMNYQYRPMHTAPAARGALGGLLLGVGFAFGWTPCIGPTLGAILTAGSESGPSLQGLWLVVAYCAGLGLPFLALALAARWVSPVLRALNRRRRAINLASAAVLIVMGIVLILPGGLANLSIWMAAHLPGWIVNGVAI